MDLLYKILFYISGFIIIWAMIGYPLSLKLINKFSKKKRVQKDYSHQPTVTVMVVAHNEEKVILEKLNNIIELNYPYEKIEFLIASDNSTDKTNEIVQEFINDHPDLKIQLYPVRARKGKTNAQNEAQKLVETKYLVMTDANSILDKESIIELMAAFTSDKISYVTGKLAYINHDINGVTSSETSYWDSDMAIREIEGRIQTITAGNGAIYACRTQEYYDFNPIESHDSSMPIFYALKGKRAIANHDAIAYEKAGEIVSDEFSRKVRMNRVLLKHILPNIRMLNVFKYKWFTYFYFGHRTCRYLLWISHLVIFISNALLVSENWVYLMVFIGQLLFYLLALMKLVTKSTNRYLNLIYYYCITVFAQWVGVYKILTGKAKPFWEKAESTR